MNNSKTLTVVIIVLSSSEMVGTLKYAGYSSMHVLVIRHLLMSLFQSHWRQ